MQMERKLFCHWDLVRLIGEERLMQQDGTYLTLSLTDLGHRELMIFLGKDVSSPDYEVIVYKSKPSDKYVPHESDNVKHHEENDEYATFLFSSYESAHHFVDFLPYCHHEYLTRPSRAIETPA